MHHVELANYSDVGIGYAAAITVMPCSHMLFVTQPPAGVITVTPNDMPSFPIPMPQDAARTSSEVVAGL